MKVESSVPSVDVVCATLATVLTDRQWMLACAESCSGGLIAAACTDLPGSSLWFERGFVSYSNAAKTELLGVEEKLILQHGAVSPEVACAMADGALRRSHAQVTLAVTGIAGPSGATVGKPVGTVCFAWNLAGTVSSETRQWPGDRAAVRLATVHHALERLLQLLQSHA